eukprot:scaffold108921_cov41-Attheya_sp.AAC.2
MGDKALIKFVIKFGSVNALTTCSIAIGKITSLAHESWNHTMKDGRFQAKRLATDGSFALFTRSQTTKVFRRFDNYGCKEFHGDASSCFTTNLNIKEHTRIGQLIGSFRN